MENRRTAVYLDLLRSSRAETLRVAQAVPEAARLRQLAEGKAHPLWLVGHLANTLNFVMWQWTLGRENALPRKYGKVYAPDFVGGLPVTNDPAVYPPWDETLASYETMMSQCIDAATALTDTDLPRPPQGAMPERLKDRFSSVEVVLQTMVMHDSYHRGQMGLIAKAG